MNDKMVKRFAEAFDSYNCRDILKCDISTQEGLACARENHLFTELCPQMVAGAVDILEQE